MNDYLVSDEINQILNGFSLKNEKPLRIQSKNSITSYETIATLNQKIFRDIATIEWRTLDQYSIDEQGNVIRK